MIFRAIRRGYRIIEIPYVCLPRQRGVSKTGSGLVQYLRLGIRYVRIACRLRWNAFFTGRRPIQEPSPVPSSRKQTSQSVVIRAMQAEQVPLVAGLHHRVLHQTLNSRLGIPFLEDLYGSILLDPKARVWIALDQDRVLGFLSATLDLHATQSYLMSQLFWRDRFVAMFHILTSFRDLRDYLSHQRLAWHCRRFGRPYRTILTVGIHPDWQGSGAATMLLEEADAFFKVSKVSAYHVDTLQDNPRALAFYHKSGFEIVGTVWGNILLVHR